MHNHARDHRYYRVARVLIKRNPLKSILIAAIVAFWVGVGCYHFLVQYEWGRWLMTLVATMYWSEASVSTMVATGRPFWEIVFFILLADGLIITGEILVYAPVLAWRRSKGIFDWLTWQLKKLLMLPLRPLSHYSPRFQRWLDRLEARFSGYHKNPGTVGLGVLFLLGLVPRIPGMVVGGVSIAVFALRYNKTGFPGWIALISAILLRHGFWLGAQYGLWSLF